METLLIPAAEDSPRIYFNPETPVNGKYLFEITGESRPADAKKFFFPVFNWIREFKEDSKYWGTLGRKIRIKFKLDYFNSPSAKCFFDIICRINELHKTYPQTDFKIIWTYDENDEDIKLAGEEFSEMVEVPFHIVLNYLYLEPTLNTPKIVINTEKKIFEISGKSYSENVENVFRPLFEWMDKYGEKYFNQDFLFNFKVIYFNSPSMRMVRETLVRLENLQKTGRDLKVNFYYETEDDLDDLKLFFKGLKIPCNLIKTESTPENPGNN